MANKISLGVRIAGILLAGAGALLAVQVKPKPAKGAAAAPAEAAAGHRPGRRVRIDKSKAPEINHCSKDALTKLPGITPALADKIIAKRPYLTTADLVTEGILSRDLYFSIQDKIIVAPPSVKPAATPKP
jgi:DNA uptake protein ComE-like DNA-binding protein